MLSRGALHVYGIKREIYELSDGCFKLSEGRLYPLLRQLENRGFVSGQDAVSNTGRLVREYRLTQSGAVELAARLKAWEIFVHKINWILDKR